MSNVAYRCASHEEANKNGCGGRMFARPGGINVKCHRCGGNYKQVEVSHAPDFGFYDPNAGVNRSVTGHSAQGMKGGAKPVPANEKKVKQATELDLADYDQLVALYMEKFHAYPDGRWGIERLKKEVEKAETAKAAEHTPELASDDGSDDSSDDGSDNGSESEAKEDTDGVETGDIA